MDKEQRIAEQRGLSLERSRKNTRQVNLFKPPLIRQQRTRLVKAQLLWFLLARLSLRKMDTLLLGGRVKVDTIM